MLVYVIMFALLLKNAWKVSEEKQNRNLRLWNGKKNFQEFDTICHIYMMKKYQEKARPIQPIWQLIFCPRQCCPQKDIVEFHFLSYLCHLHNYLCMIIVLKSLKEFFRHFKSSDFLLVCNLHAHIGHSKSAFLPHFSVSLVRDIRESKIWSWLCIFCQYVLSPNENYKNHNLLQKYFVGSERCLMWWNLSPRGIFCLFCL